MPCPDRWLVEKFQPFAKTWFELIRTAFVVALFDYIASKSDSNIVKLFALFTYVLFAYYCLTYIILSHPPIRSTAKNSYLRLTYDAFGFIALVILFWYFGEVFQSVIDGLIKAQFK
jgi:hypothetical protein